MKTALGSLRYAIEKAKKQQKNTKYEFNNI